MIGLGFGLLGLRKPSVVQLSFVLALVLLQASSQTSAAPTARFTARPIQGTICVAPCAVHFDAIGLGALSAPTPYVSAETTDPDFDRPFHSLLFTWDFGDPGSGVWEHSGMDKNSAIGGIAGHVYENAGIYTVTLTVKNPAGETSTATRTVNVVSPDTHFSPANTYCFANSATNWSGCPLNCAGGDDNCTVTNSFTQLMTSGNDCVGSSDCADADAQPKRILLRRGDTFNSTSFVNVANNRGPGLVEAFGSGRRPVVNLNGGNNWHQAGGWTVTEVTLTNSSYAALLTAGPYSAGAPPVNNVTFFNVDATELSGACIYENPTARDVVGSLHAFVEVNCRMVPGHNNYAAWPGSRYTLWMGGTFDKNGGTNSSLRSHHMQHYLLQHTKWINPAPTREHWQFRTMDDYTGFSLDQEAQMFNIISDNQTVEAADNGFFTVRVCVDSGCNCSEGTTATWDCGNSSFPTQGRIVPVHDLIFERNFHSWNTRTDASKLGIYEIQGGGVTIRNNVYDLQDGMAGLASLVVVTGEPVAHLSGSTPDGDVHVLNNTIFFDHLSSGSFRYTNNRGSNGSGCPSGCLARNNLVVAPGFGGSFAAAGGFTASNNLVFNSGEPFVAPVQEQNLTSIDSFTLRDGASTVIDTGYVFDPSTDRASWVHTDMKGGCRPAGPAWDIGASEFGAASCLSTGAASGAPPVPPGGFRVD